MMRLRPHHIIEAIAGIALLYVAAVVFLFWQSSRPVIIYEEVRPVGNALSPACVGEDYVFEVHAVISRAPAVVAVVEAWISKDDPRQTIIDSDPDWRILSRAMEADFTVRTHVPEKITPGEYTYQRALGLQRPFVLELPVMVLPSGQCGAAP